MSWKHETEDRILQALAAENNLSETAFLVQTRSGFDLRWFTPITEVALCGHATLASAFVLFECRNWPADTVKFQTRKSGELSVMKRDRLLKMDFPARPAHPVVPPAEIAEALHITPAGVFGSEEDLLVVLESEDAVRRVQPDFDALLRIPSRGVIITARGDRSDFVSRFFAPQVGVPEDPVTGSAHCVLTPHWGPSSVRRCSMPSRSRSAGESCFVKAVAIVSGSPVKPYSIWKVW